MHPGGRLRSRRPPGVPGDQTATQPPAQSCRPSWNGRSSRGTGRGGAELPLPSADVAGGVAGDAGSWGPHRVPNRVRWTLGFAVLLVVAFVVSLLVRRTGSYYTPVDGWGVVLLEFTMGNFCIARYFEGSWRASNPVARLFPLIMGMACISWALGDLVLTIESLGGATPSTPSLADLFYVGFFPLCFLAFALLIRRGNRSSLLATSLDGLIAGLGVAALSAAFVVAAVIRVTGGGKLAAATNLVYPMGDLLLLALAVGGLLVLPKGFRPFFVIICVALTANAIGDGFNLLQPMSRFGYVANGAAWPISLTLIAVAVTILPPRVESPVTERVAGFALPAFGAAISMGILVAASFWHIGRPAIALATVTLFVASVRLALTLREAHSLKTARFRSLIDKTWDLIAVTEADLRIAYITPSAERILGYPSGDLEGRPFTELVHPDDSGMVIEQLVGLTDAGTVVFEVRMRHADGHWRTVDWTAADLLDDPSVNGYVLNGGDVTEARQAAHDLVAARDAALVASKTKSQFVSMMSHEIRTPMNGVIGLTDLLLETALDEEQLELASGVKLSAESLLVIINDILDFSKIEAGKLEIEESALSVPNVVDDVGRILAGTAHAKGIELLVDMQPDVPTALLGDGTRIRQVLLNFGANAVKFTSGGEVVIRVRMLHQNSERVALHFDVVDTGIGIAQQDQERLFSAFAQADSSTTRKFGGTGLGLTISRQLVELMGEGSVSRAPPGRDRPSGSSSRCDARTTCRPTRGPGTRARSPVSARWSWTTMRPTAGSSASSCSPGASRPWRPPTDTRRSSSRSPRPRTAAVRSGRGRPEHARHGRPRAGRHAEGGSRHRADHALPPELLRPSARGRRIASHRVRRQPHQARPLL